MSIGPAGRSPAGGRRASAPGESGPEDETGAAGGGGVLGRRALETLGFRVAGLPLGLATTILTSRLLLPEGRGAYVIGVLTVTLAATVVSVDTAVTHELARRERSPGTILAHGLLFALGLGVVGGVLLVPANALLADGPQQRAIQLFVLGLPALLTVRAVGGALVGLGRLRLWNVLQLLPPAVLLAGLVVLVGGLDRGVEGAATAWLVAQWLAAGVAITATRPIWSRREPRLARGRTRPFLRLTLAAGLVNVVALLNYRIELIFLEGFLGLDAVGVYSVAMSLAELLWLLSATISTVVVAPAIRREHAEAAAVVARATRHALLLTGAAALGLGAVSVVAVPVVFGDAFEGAVLPLAILLPGVVAYAPASVLSAYFSMRLGRMRYPLAAAGTSALVTAVGCAALIPWLDTAGAALASVIGYATGCGWLAAAFLRRSGVPARELVPRPSDLAAYRELAGWLLARRPRRGPARSTSS